MKFFKRKSTSTDSDLTVSPTQALIKGYNNFSDQLLVDLQALDSKDMRNLLAGVVGQLKGLINLLGKQSSASEKNIIKSAWKSGYEAAKSGASIDSTDEAAEDYFNQQFS